MLRTLLAATAALIITAAPASAQTDPARPAAGGAMQGTQDPQRMEAARERLRQAVEQRQPEAVMTSLQEIQDTLRAMHAEGTVPMQPYLQAMREVEEAMTMVPKADNPSGFDQTANRDALAEVMSATEQMTQAQPQAQQSPAQAPQAAAEGAASLNPHQRLSLGKAQLQQAAVRLQRAKDTAGADRVERSEVDEAKEMAMTALGQVDGALEALQQTGNSDEAQQAIRNARLEWQSAQTAVMEMDPEAPGIAIQALKDLDRAAAEVQDTTQVAAQPAAR